MAASASVLRLRFKGKGGSSGLAEVLQGCYRWAGHLVPYPPVVVSHIFVMIKEHNVAHFFLALMSFLSDHRKHGFPCEGC